MAFHQVGAFDRGDMLGGRTAEQAPAGGCWNAELLLSLLAFITLEPLRILFTIRKRQS